MAVAYGSNLAHLNSYRSQAVTALTPGGLLVKTYDVAIAALSVQDGQRACKAVASLIDALDFEHAEIAGGLFRLYRYCMEQIKQGDMAVPTRILTDLRDTWAQAIEGLLSDV